MIVNPDQHNMTPQDNPPSYDLLTGGETGYPSYSNPSKPLDVKHPEPVPESQPSHPSAGPSYTTQPEYTPSPVVYHYTNPLTREHVASLLPPNHPEMVCLQAGAHVPQTKYGLLGILAAVFWFPLGIGLCLLDRRVKCIRCGLLIDEGLCH